MTKPNTKRMYAQVTSMGATVTMDPVDVADWVAHELQGEPYTVKGVELTDEEADALPEFGGY